MKRQEKLRLIWFFSCLPFWWGHMALLRNMSISTNRILLCVARSRNQARPHQSEQSAATSTTPTPGRTTTVWRHEEPPSQTSRHGISKPDGGGRQPITKRRDGAKARFGGGGQGTSSKNRPLPRPSVNVCPNWTPPTNDSMNLKAILYSVMMSQHQVNSCNTIWWKNTTFLEQFASLRNLI